MTRADGLRIDHGVASGTFSLDGETFEVENNIWVVGNDRECLVVDAPHDVHAILEVVAGREVRGILCTHAHDDHVRVAPALRAETGAPIYLHPADRPLWDLVHPHVVWDIDLGDGQAISLGGATLRVLHTPGHAPGAVSFHAPTLSCVFTGDTLFHGGPGATGRSFSDRPTLDASIATKLFELSGSTDVHPGHGASTTIQAERLRALSAAISARMQNRLPGEAPAP